jgi:hypothetical protein
MSQIGNDNVHQGSKTISSDDNIRLSSCVVGEKHSYDILGAGMLWKPKEARILTNFIDQPVNFR